MSDPIKILTNQNFLKYLFYFIFYEINTLFNI